MADLFLANVVLLCHADGTNGSTTFTDTTGRHTLTAVLASVTTVQAKFGTGSLDTSGNAGASLQVTGNLGDFDFQSSPFTMECWAWLTGSHNPSSLFSQFNNSSGGGWFWGAVSGTYALWYYNGAGTQVAYNTGVAMPATGAWHHYAADRDASGTMRLYIDGAVIGSTSAPTWQTVSVQANIGASNRATDAWTGYVDEVRITKGVARYAGAFTPPTAPFDDPPTYARATQVISEQWIMPNANAQATQVLMEMWAPGGTTTPRAVATLVAMEQWASSGLAPPTTAQARAWILA